ncbi:FtsQ-type POTRA domain-containing protein [Myxococcota bacterium]|nr:FtsQ-type POTRA domain-containing protein [Myxococcota bacterium]MBU1379633.1 FtsQ-type POTRA domain-containing protein [Myxococcota bacterium]MBU1498010.1 FtsQ-type POTRA domain-containing protein [Myxococcota bacterium]
MRIPKLRKKATPTRGVRRVIKEAPSSTDEVPVPEKERFKLPEIDLKKYRAPVGGFLFLVLLLFGIYKGYQYVYHGTHFRLRHVKIGHTRQIEKKEVIRQSGLSWGTNIFKVKPGEVRKKLVEHPWIREARVWRKLPDTIVIEIEEESAVCSVLFLTSGGENNFYLLNSKGQIFKKAETSALKGKFIITGFSREDYNLKPAVISRRLKRVIDMMEVYSSNSARPAVSEVYVKHDSARLILKESTTSVQVDLENYKQQFAVLDQFLANVEIALKDINLIYLDNRENPTRALVIPVIKKEEKDEDDEGKLQSEKDGKKIKTKYTRKHVEKLKADINPLNKKKNKKSSVIARQNANFTKKTNNHLSSNR